jgi:hypothetical protein
MVRKVSCCIEMWLMPSVYGCIGGDGKVEEDDDKTRVPEMEEQPVSKSHNKWMTFKSAVHSMFHFLTHNVLASLNGKCAKRRQNIQYE